MPFEITNKNAAALEPLFKPWENPQKHRVKNENPGQPAKIIPGRRPSNCPLVRSIRSEVDAWRDAGYPGISSTSKTLLNYWFSTEHLTKDENGSPIPFRYHWAQREAMETIIYLVEQRHIESVSSLLSELGGETYESLALGIQPEHDRWPRNCCKIATGGGKTKVMSLAIIWSYFHKLYEPDSSLAQHFVLIAPNLTVYERLKDDFENNKIFNTDPLIPEEWKSDFQLQVVLQDSSGGASTTGALYLTNIHRLYPKEEEKEEEDHEPSLLGPNVRRAQALNTGEALRSRIASHPSILVMNDEAHHLHDPDLAWNRAIDTLHSLSRSRGNAGICLQLDFSATPKHNDGTLFNHIVCDFPLGEAVDAGIVKVPVIGESQELKARGDVHTAAHVRFAIHLKLGYERYCQTFEELKATRKPILFVMTEDAQSANEIANYLDSDLFPLLKDHVLNLHTRLKGKFKTYKRNGKEVKEWVETETGIKPDDLKALREMSRELDKPNSRYRCVVSVMMLREGWDVRNVTTIIPLRPYSAKANILPEQTLGRGLRRMFPQGDMPELVTVVHHPAFRKLYEDELAQEGFDIAYTPLGERIKQTSSIYVDRDNKDVSALEIEIPTITDAIVTQAELTGLTFEEIKAYFQAHFHPLPIGKKRADQIEYKERHLFTDEVILSMKLDAGLLANAYSAIAYFAQELGRACHVNNPHQSLSELIEKFIREILFEKPVDIFSGEVDHRMRDLDVMEYIRATFAPLILDKIVQKVERKSTRSSQKLSNWLPFQASSTERAPAIPAGRTMFNLVPCESDLEESFTDFCDTASDVAAFAKNSGPQKLMIDYIKPDGNRAFYVPDFFVRAANGVYLLVELKGKTDTLVPLKARAANEWCRVASKGGAAWNYLYVPYQIFQQGSFASIEELARACTPSLASLIAEAKSGQMALPMEEAKAQKESDEFLAVILSAAGVDKLPADIQLPVKEAVASLQYSIKTGMHNLGGAFQCLFFPLEFYSLAILDRQLRPKFPPQPDRLDEYFNPTIENIPNFEKRQLIETQRRLKNNLIYGRNNFRMGCLLFCLRFAKDGTSAVPALWRDIYFAFRTPQFLDLFNILAEVNNFRNLKIAHSEEVLSDKQEAQEAMAVWVKCLVMMVNVLEKLVY